MPSLDKPKNYPWYIKAADAVTKTANRVGRNVNVAGELPFLPFRAGAAALKDVAAPFQGREPTNLKNLGPMFDYNKPGAELPSVKYDRNQQAPIARPGVTDTDFDQAEAAEAALVAGPASFSDTKPRSLVQSQGPLEGQFLPGGGRRELLPPSTEAQDLVNARTTPYEPRPVRVNLPQAPDPSTATFGDLMKYRIGLLGTGANLAPQVAQRGEARRAVAAGNDAAELGLTALSTDRNIDAGRAQIALDRETEAQRRQEKSDYHNILRRGQDLKALTSNQSGFSDYVKNRDARQSYINTFDPTGPTAPSQILGQTTLDFSEIYGVPPDDVERLINNEIRLAEAAGEVDLDNEDRLTAIINQVRARLESATSR